jgi:hypothetical protein
MFARKVSVCLKPNALRAFTNLIEDELLPWLRKQSGFRDLITLACPDAIEVQVISFWEHDASAKACSEEYPENVLRMLEKLLDGISYGKTFEVVTSTLERFSPPKIERTKAELGTDLSDLPYGSCETSV